MPRSRIGDKACDFAGCDRTTARAAYCRSHSAQLARSGRLTPLRPINLTGVKTTCVGPSCSNDAISRGMCSGHWAQNRVGKALTELRPKRRASERAVECGVPRCAGPDDIRGICRRHFAQIYPFTISPDDFIRMVQENPACSICERDRPLVIDHDHRCCPESGRSCGSCVRGLICRQCNSAIGMLGDDPDMVDRAAAYLRERN